MNTNRYIQDYLLAERQQERLQDAARQRVAFQAAQSTSRHGGLRHVIGRSGALLVALGTWMERIEQVKREQTLVKGASASGRLR